MIKRLTVVFAVLAAVSVLAIIPLTPFAVRDLSNILIPRYNQLKSVQPVEVFPLDGSITTLSLSLEDTYRLNSIRITHSESGEIIVKSDQLSQSGLKVGSSVQGDTINISFHNEYAPLNFLSTDDSGEIWDNLIQMAVDDVNVELSIPDGLILVNGEGKNLLDQEGSKWRHIIVDRDVQYFRVEDVINPDGDISSQKPVSSFDARVKLLRNDLLQLVKNNAEGNYTQLEFNMNLNDCRIRLEALLLEYAKEQDLINYDKYKEQETSSSKRTGIRATIGTPPAQVDTSVDEAEAKSIIRELSSLYLSRLVVQAKLDVIIMNRQEDEYTFTEEQEALEQQIEEYTAEIKEVEGGHTEFVTSLMATGLLF